MTVVDRVTWLRGRSVGASTTTTGQNRREEGSESQTDRDIRRPHCCLLCMLFDDGTRASREGLASVSQTITACERSVVSMRA
ncbi:MAG TPA: hypothetical protein VFK10_06605, partial [Burkholderiaceae bacterium]|nr:hypothetical protein [Burkholderiaceae bacterium]